MFNNEDEFKNLIDRFKIDDKPSGAHKDSLREQMLQTFNASRQKDSQTTINTQTFWRTIMKSKITKLAAAAVIIIAVVLSVTVLDKSTSTAYALEQTMKAYEGLQFVHIKHFKQGESEPQEFWVKYDDKEVKQFRINSPKWAEPTEGPLKIVWKNGKMEVLGKDENGRQAIIIRQRTGLGKEMLEFVKKADPRTMVEWLHQLEIEGKAQITTSEPKVKSEPITITAKFPSDSKDIEQMIWYIDQNTKLVTRLVFNKAKESDGGHSYEFSDYNIAVDEKFFNFKDVSPEVPRYDLAVPKYDSAARYDMSEIGLVQGQLGDNEIAVALAQQFVQALIDKDYEKAAKLCSGTPAHNSDKVESFINRKTYKRLLYVEQPMQDANVSNKLFNVPCYAVVYCGGTLVVQANIKVEPYTADPNRWVVADFNDFHNNRMMMTTDPTETTATFMKNINVKLALLDINKSTADDVIRVLGEPWAYSFHNENLEKNNLPQAYTMSYPGNFMVSIYKNQVMQWGCYPTVPGYEIPGYTLFNSIQIGTTLDDVFKIVGSPAKVVEGFGDASNKVMYEDNIIYANMGINERKGFCFSTDNNGEKVRMYYDDNVLYKDLKKIKGFCFYGTVHKGKRIRIFSKDNKVTSLHEYRTEPIKAME